ncbi:MAG: hypothetical protein Wins2KO_00950 [Winogradskyella sp.]
MKKLFILFLLSFSLLACSSDDNGSNNTSGNILGTWNGVSVDLSGSTNVDFQGQNFDVNFVGESYDEDFSILVTENPNVISSTGTYSLELTATILGLPMSENVEDLFLLEDSEWSRNGNELTLTAQGQSQTATIIELTDNSMTISLEVVQEIMGNMVTADAIAVFEK